MSENTLMRRRVVAGVAVVAGAVGLVAAVPASATTDDPQKIDGNPTCGELAPEGAEWTEYKVEPVEDGTEGDGTLEVTITLGDDDGGPTFDWTSNIGVDAVVVKGGSAGNVYTYDEGTEGNGLHAPKNASGSYAGLSHISFCYDADGPAPTTPPSTTPPTDVTITPNTTVPGTDTTTPGTDTTTPTGSTPVLPIAPAAQPVPGQPDYTG